MADIIHLLPDSIANQIAAGEVIQRPASAVKELLENSVDAGATSIEVFIKDAGKALIQIIDNGCGMSEMDARMSFERHATSKIKAANDLFAIRTKGFRGEALASMAAIAQVVLKSKRVEDELGTMITIEGAELKKQETCQCTEGASIAVKNLFFNVPARRNFLKSNKVEMRHIIEEFQRVALAHPDIFFSLQHNDVDLFHLNTGNLRQRIIGLFGKNYNERLVPVEESTDQVKITGFIGKPEYARKSSGERFFLVNSRFIKNPYLHHAVMNAYDELLQEGSYPLYVLFLDIDPAKIDINVHPTKQEIKFEEEKIIYTFLFSAVRRGLAQHNITPSLDFDQEDSFSKIAVFTNSKEDFSSTNVAGSGNQATMIGLERQNLKNWEQLYGAIPSSEKDVVGNDSGTKPTTVDDNELGNVEEEVAAGPFQIHKRYIVAQIKSGYILVDQQGAHERILYEKYMSRLKDSKSASQKQLFPQTINLTATDFELVKEILPEINNLGFDLEEFGNNSLVVRGIPADLENSNEEQIIEGLIEQYKQNMTKLKLEKRENLIRALVRNTSIKEGQKLDFHTMKSLLDELFACEIPNIALNGKLTFLTFNLQELAKQFEQK